MNWFDEEIEKVADATIIGCVVGAYGWGGYWEDKENPKIPHDKLYKLMTWDTAKPLLHYDWNQGHGSPSCHAITVWTKNEVIFVSQYDGSTSLCTVPRNPKDHEPEMPGS